ncbi:MAG: multidrug efflux SMR transporter [Parachlamydiaceae bacterium]|nr:multidrug efflux SMR transporter [Parachlamydiaceae bacterium]
MIYILLFLAIVSEVIGTFALKLSQGFTKLYPSITVVIAYVLSFWLMGLTLKILPVSVVYAVWSGLGIVGIVLIGVFLFNETFGIWHFFGITLILIGIVILNLVTTNGH